MGAVLILLLGKIGVFDKKIHTTNRTQQILFLYTIIFANPYFRRKAACLPAPDERTPALEKMD
jgi:hypothetical protein